MSKPDARTVDDVEVADLQSVLAALADPVRLEMVRRLAGSDGELACSALYDTVTKATASHHFKILRETGIVRRRSVGQAAQYSLRADDVDAAYPGVLSSILAAANA